MSPHVDGKEPTHLMRRNPLFHGFLDVIPLELSYDEVGITYQNVDEEIEDSDLELVCYCVKDQHRSSTQ